MDTKQFFKDVYEDFFGVEKIKALINFNDKFYDLNLSKGKEEENNEN